MTSLTLTAVELAHTAGLVLLQAVDEVPDPEDVRPGWIALGSFLLLAFVTVLLWLSMRKQLGRIDFDESDGTEKATGTAQAPPSDADRPAEDDRPVEDGHPAENGDQRS